MADLQIDVELLQKFEQGLNPKQPEKSEIPVNVLGYGEISTVLEIGGGTDLAYKRMPMFKNREESDSYEKLHKKYLEILQEEVGVNVVDSDIKMFPDDKQGIVIGYIAQKKLPPGSIGHKAIHHLSAKEAKRLITAVLLETKKVFDFNKAHKGELEVGFDGQISNWAILNFDPDKGTLDDKIELGYFDTSTPLIRMGGEEKLNPELFLRSAPSFLVWIIRLLFLQDVMNRYYDFRQVVIDLIANLYKEQLPELVPLIIETVNQFFSDEIQRGDFQPITLKEVKAYYREDAWIWRIYLSFRKVDRFLHGLFRKNYPYILPAKINR